MKKERPFVDFVQKRRSWKERVMFYNSKVHWKKWKDRESWRGKRGEKKSQRLVKVLLNLIVWKFQRACRMNMWTKTYFCHQVGNKEYFQFRFSFEPHFISQSVDDTNCLCHSCRARTGYCWFLCNQQKMTSGMTIFLNEKRLFFLNSNHFAFHKQPAGSRKGYVHKFTYTRLLEESLSVVLWSP